MFDLTDETTAAASPATAYAAVVAEHNGATLWWTPHLSAELRHDDTYDTIGALVDNSAVVPRPWPIRLETREARPGELVRVADVDGAFRGQHLWKFEAVESETRLRYRWRVRPSGWLCVLSPFLPVQRSQSDTMQACFLGLKLGAGVPQTPG